MDNVFRALVMRQLASQYVSIAIAICESVRTDLGAIGNLSRDVICECIDKRMQNHDDFKTWSVETRRGIFNRVFNTLCGYGVLEPLLAEKGITEIMVNGLEGIFVEYNGEVFKWQDRFSSNEELERVIHRMVTKVNRTVSTAQPLVDGRLEDGSRIHVVLPPVAINGPIITIRKFTYARLATEEMVRQGVLTQEVLEFLKEQVRSKRNIIISGGTGTGKTTLLNCISQWLCENERIITIEDACELQLSQLKNWVKLEVRQSSADDEGGIGMRDLVRASLRMRPDRIIVGEVRGEEVMDMLQAMNTGHQGSMSTIHANSVKDVFVRLTTLMHLHTRLELEAIKMLIQGSIDLIIHLERGSNGTRRIVEIGEIARIKNGHAEIRTLFCFDCTENHLVKCMEEGL